MSRNVVIAIVAAIVIIVILFLIPWGGEEPVETGAVTEETVETEAADLGEEAEVGAETEEATDEVEAETEQAAAEVDQTTEAADTAGSAGQTEEAAEEPVQTIEVEGEAEIVETEDTAGAAAGEDQEDQAQAQADAEGAEPGVAGATEPAEVDPAVAEEVLTVEGFDYESVVQIIEVSEIPAEQQETLTSDLEAAQDDPEELGNVLERVRTALEEAG